MGPLLKLVNVDSMNESVGGKLLRYFGIELDPEVVEFIVSNIKQVAKEKNITKLGDVMSDPELLASLQSLIPEPTPKVEHNDAPDTIALEAVVDCPHCGLPFAVHDSPAVKSHTKG
jgi:hypothetical protein